MARIWNSRKEVETAVDTICNIMDIHGCLPHELVTAYRESLTKVSRGMIQLFYERLTEKCPDALNFFVSKQEVD
jgi:hypothetical protein